MARFALVQLIVAIIYITTAIATPTRTKQDGARPKRFDLDAAIGPTPSKEYTTNAKRFAAGLPPLAPRWSRTRPRRAPKPRNSIINVASGTYSLQRASDGTVLEQRGDAVLVNDGSQWDSGSFNHLTFTGYYGPYRNGASAVDKSVGMGSSNYVLYIQDESPWGFPSPFKCALSENGCFVESSIWKLNPPANLGDPGHLSLIWTNPDGSTVECPLYELNDGSGYPLIIGTPDIQAALEVLHPIAYYPLVALWE